MGVSGGYFVSTDLAGLRTHARAQLWPGDGREYMLASEAGDLQQIVANPPPPM